LRHIKQHRVVNNLEINEFNFSKQNLRHKVVSFQAASSHHNGIVSAKHIKQTRLL
jgi:hypothetical protein